MSWLLTRVIEELIGKHLPSLLEEAGGQVRPSEKTILGRPFYDAASKTKGAVPAGFKPQQRLNLSRWHWSIVQAEERE